MRIVLTCLASVLIPLLPVQARAAAQLFLSAGEHGAYSRVAIPFDGSGWSSAQEGRSVRITLPGVTGPVNTSAIFPRRAAHRVLNVAVSQAAGATTLTFELNCACAAKIYAWKRGKILMDIRNGTPAMPAKPNPPKHVDQPAATSAGRQVDELDIEKARASLMERLQAAADAGVVQMTQDMPPVAEPASEPEKSSMPAPEMAEMAASTGHEVPSVAPPMPFTPPPAAMSHDVSPMQEEMPPGPATSIMFGNDIAGNSRKFCLADSQLKLGAWRSRDPFSKELARKRTALLGEFDAPDEKAGIALARFYLSHGLGEEAALMVSEFVSGDNPQAALVTDLANIFRGKTIPADGPILGAGQCDGAHALWQAAALALDEHWQDAAKAEKRSGDALAQLPRNIRIPVGVHIAQAALNAGQMEQVRRILALLRRSGKIGSPSLDLIEGKFALAENLQDRAHGLLDPLTRSIHPEAVEATLALSRAELVSPGYLSEDRLIDLALIAMERRYTPPGREALILTAWAETAAGRPGQALDILSREADSSSLATEKAELRREIAQTLLGLYKPGAGQASLQKTDLFWRYQSYLDDNQTSRDIRRGAARHLMAKGLPNAALSLLSKPGVESGPPFLRAEALMAVGQASQALNILRPYARDPRTLEMRSKALAQLGRYGAAAGLIPEDSRDPELLKLKADLLWTASQWGAAARLYTRLAGNVPAADDAEVNRRLTAATYMAADDALTRETLAFLKARDDTGLAELLTPSKSPSLPLPEQVDLSLQTAQTLSRLLKEILADG